LLSVCLFVCLLLSGRSSWFIQASSAPSERLWSAAGNVITNKRASLNDDLAETLVFLSENRRVLWSFDDKKK